MALKKHRLELAIEEDFCLLGLVSDDPDYKLCWRINKDLGTDFRKEEDLELYHKKLDEDQFFSFFLWSDEDAHISYRLIRNYSENGHYLEEIRNLDYLIHIQGDFNTEKIRSFMEAIQALDSVRMCVPVDLSRIKQMDRLLLW